MKKCFQLFAFLLLSLCSLAALAAPTVQEVEGEIAAGQYDKAKALIKVVLKEHPDSIVANKYMLQILDLEYAQTLKPSVEYKLYENNIATIQAKIAKDKQEAYDKKIAEERTTLLKGFLWILGVVAIGLFSYYVIYPKVRGYYYRKQQEKEEANWMQNAWADIVDIGVLINTMYSNAETKPYGTPTMHLLNSLAEDNDDVTACLERKDFNRELVDKHIKDAYAFFKKHGVEV